MWLKKIFGYQFSFGNRDGIGCPEWTVLPNGESIWTASIIHDPNRGWRGSLWVDWAEFKKR